MDDEITPKEIRDGLADVGRLELGYFNVERDVLDSEGLLELHEQLEQVFNNGGELSFNKEQGELVFLAVRFASVFRSLHRVHEQLENYNGE